MSAGARSSRTPLADVTRSLTAFGVGCEPAHLRITTGELVDLHTRQIHQRDHVASRPAVAPLAE